MAPDLRTSTTLEMVVPAGSTRLGLADITSPHTSALLERSITHCKFPHLLLPRLFWRSALLRRPLRTTLGGACCAFGCLPPPRPCRLALSLLLASLLVLDVALRCCCARGLLGAACCGRCVTSPRWPRDAPCQSGGVAAVDCHRFALSGCAACCRLAEVCDCGRSSRLAACTLGGERDDASASWALLLALLPAAAANSAAAAACSAAALACRLASCSCHVDNIRPDPRAPVQPLPLPLALVVTLRR